MTTYQLNFLSDPKGKVNEKPYWYKLLDVFERKRYFWNGLTIPFIIGSREYTRPYEYQQTIGDLIEEINC